MIIIHSESHKLHATQSICVTGHPFSVSETPDRIESILHCISNLSAVHIDTAKDFGLAPILAVHDHDYIAFLAAVGELGQSHLNTMGFLLPDTFPSRQSATKPFSLKGLLGYYAFCSDSPIMAHTWEACYGSAQCALTAAHYMHTTGDSAYALCRPPGHHACYNLFGGFCYLNNAAVATKYLQNITGPDCRIAILDIDYHHGNGTQSIFYSDPSVLFCSLHGDPSTAFPHFWGTAAERGEAAGYGFNWNWPLPDGTNEVNYLKVLDEAIDIIRQFQPRYLIVSTGYDIVNGDPHGTFTISTTGLAVIGARIASVSLPVLIIQEGGYMVSHLGEQACSFITPFVRMEDYEI